MTGPSSIQGAQVIRLKKANCTVVAHSQARDRKSAQPSARSARRLGRAAGLVLAPSVPGVASGSRSRPSASTLTAYDAASAATTTAGPARATRIPPSAGPAMLVAEPASPYRAFALPSWSRGAISVVSASRAGEKNAVPVPPSQASMTNSHSVGRPKASAVASAAWAPQRSMSAASITRRRPSRSATAPASGSSTTCETTVAAKTTPRPVAPILLSSTAHAMATVDIDEPSREVTKPV
jgi:hypothetical protein